MTDFKGRKDFPEVADNKIKIGDYSGMNRLSVVDIYSPKEEPELRDQIMEPVKGASNNYDSPILSQQPVIVLSDDVSEEAFLINAIDGYVLKEKNDGYVTKAEVQKIIGTVLGKIPIVGDIAENILSADTDETNQDLEKIIPMPMVDKSDLPSIYKICDVVLFPSLYEGMDTISLEGMRCGIPVVCSNTSSFPEIAGNGALMCNPTDDIEITKNILKHCE